MQSADIDGRTRASQPLWSALPGSNISNVSWRREVEPCQTLFSSCLKQSWGNILKTTPAAIRLPKLTPICNQGAESQSSHSWHLCKVRKRLREAKVRERKEDTRGVRKAAERPQWHCSLLRYVEERGGGQQEEVQWRTLEKEAHLQYLNNLRKNGKESALHIIIRYTQIWRQWRGREKEETVKLL